MMDRAIEQAVQAALRIVAEREGRTPKGDHARALLARATGGFVHNEPVYADPMGRA